VTDSDWQRLAAVGSATVLGHRRRGHLQFASGPLPQQQSSLGCAVLYESTVRGTPFWPVHTVLCTYNVLQCTVHTVSTLYGCRCVVASPRNRLHAGGSVALTMSCRPGRAEDGWWRSSEENEKGPAKKQRPARTEQGPEQDLDQQESQRPEGELNLDRDHQRSRPVDQSTARKEHPLSAPKQRAHPQAVIKSRAAVRVARGGDCSFVL
jgi:hypothetical protein